MANALKLPVDEPSRWVGRVNIAGGGGRGGGSGWTESKKRNKEKPRKKGIRE